MDVSGLQVFAVCKCRSCAAEFFVPDFLGHLRLDRPLPPNGCVKVFDGFDLKQKTYSTIYLLDFSDCSECGAAKLVEQARDEAVLLSTLNHSNICPVIGHGQINSYFVATSPYMDGFDLSDYKPEEHGYLKIDDILNILQNAALGLAVAHHKEIIHHNVCPANIHVDERGKVRIKNFFTSRLLYKNCVRNDWTKDITPHFYISPEKTETRQEGRHGDVFSFGVTAYFLLTGKYPFYGKDRRETVFSRIMTGLNATPPLKKDFYSANEQAAQAQNNKDIAYREPIEPMKLRAEIPKLISDGVMRMLSYYPQRRPSMPEFISTVNYLNATLDSDKIFDAQWDMVVPDTDTKLIPKMSRIGPQEYQKEKPKPKFSEMLSIKSLFKNKEDDRDEWSI
jgi:serine/threonine protein kinase